MLFLVRNLNKCYIGTDISMLVVMSANKKMLQKAIERQKNIYIRGIAGIKPEVPTEFSALERKAKDMLSAKAFAYIAGGAGTGQTMIQNRWAFDAYKICPRMLNDVSDVRLTREIYGDTWPLPIALAPVGVLELVHKKADLAVAEACAVTGIPMVFSNQASVPMEACAQALGSTPKWFQLYWSKENELVKSLVIRAQNAGCSAIVVTLDTTMLGWRPQDLDMAFLPFLAGRGIAQYTSDPVFMKIVENAKESGDVKPPVNLKTILHVLSLANRFPGSYWKNIRSGVPLKAVKTFIQIYSRPSLTWRDLSFLRSITNLPIVLKGISHPDDVRTALAYDVQGIIISNHGGRQVDGAVSSLEVLDKAVKASLGKIDIFFDSGIRSGADVMKALCLGAKAVFVGRPYVYGLAINGTKGVEAVINNIAADFELNMRLSGCSDVNALNKNYLSKI